MTDLMQYVLKLDALSDGRGLPPVEKWNPEYCGEIDLVIKRDGTWFHEGTPIGRARLVRLFSTVIRRDDEEYFLVTPVEKMKITVEDAPFLAVLMDKISNAAGQTQLCFTTNVGDKVVAGPEHPIEMRLNPKTGEKTPYIKIRRNLDALISRSLFYDLVSLGETEEIDGIGQFGVKSTGVFFPMQLASEVFEEE